MLNISNVMIIPNVTKPETLEYTGKLCRFFDEKGIGTTVINDLAAPVTAPADMAVVLGGDGSVLMGVSYLKDCNIPIIGINFGHFGYLTECTPSHGFEAIEKVLRGEYIIEERMMLACRILEGTQEGKIYNALNDAVIYRGSLMHILTMPLVINGKEIAEFQCDGIIVATPTGSTAYNLSAGGPVLVPTSENFAITPICQRERSCSSIVSSGTDIIRAKADKMSYLCIDGQIQIPLDPGTGVEFFRSARKTRIIKVSDSSFYTALQRKLAK